MIWLSQEDRGFLKRMSSEISRNRREGNWRRLAGPDPASAEFKLLATKLFRQRNAVEDGFYQANTLIEDALHELEDWVRPRPS